MIHQGRFEAKVAVVTGAAQGIGYTVAANLAREGGMVALIDRSELIHEVREKLAWELRDKLPAGGAEIMAIVADLERYADCRRVMARARAHFGRIDILINNVGGTIWAKPYEHYDEQQIEAEIRRSLFRPCGAATRCCLTCSNRAPGRSSTCPLSRPVASTACLMPPLKAVSTPSPRRLPSNTRARASAWSPPHPAEPRHPSGATRAARPPGPTRRRPGTSRSWTDSRIHPPQEVRDAGREAAPILFLASDEASYIVGSTLPVEAATPANPLPRPLWRDTSPHLRETPFADRVSTQPNCQLAAPGAATGKSILLPGAPGARRSRSAPRYHSPGRRSQMKPDLTWTTLTSTATAIPMPASTAIGGGAKRPTTPRPALRDLVAGDRGPGWVAGRCRRSLNSPRSARPGRAPSARRTPRRSACPPGSAHPGPTRPHHGRNRKPAFEQEDNSPSWRSSCSRLPGSSHRERIPHVSNVLDKGHRHHCRMPPARDDLCHGPSGRPERPCQVAVIVAAG